MLILFESAGGLALFKLTDETKIESLDNIYKAFQEKDKIPELYVLFVSRGVDLELVKVWNFFIYLTILHIYSVQLQHFEQYANIQEAVEAAKCLQSGIVF